MGLKSETWALINRIALFIALLLLVALACASALPAQSSDHPDKIRVQNMAPLARSSWVTATVPLDDEHMQGSWVVHTEPESWAILGAKASPRTRLLHVFAKLEPWETRAFTYTLAKPASEGDEPASERAAPGAAPRFEPPAILATIDGETQLLDLASGLEVVENEGRVVVRSRGRIPGSMLVIEAWWYLYPGSRVIPFELWAICSDPRTKAMRQDIDELELRMPAGVVPVIRHAVALGAGQPRLENGSWRLNLLGPTHFADAQGHAWSGVLLLPKGANEGEARSLAAELHGGVYAMAAPKTWRRTGAWGPWGVQPTPHPSVERTFTAYVERMKRWSSWAAQPRELWSPAWLQVRRPAQTGDQYDFGVTKLSPALATRGGGPGHLDEGYFRAVRTACRRGYYREADGGPVLQANHPDLVFWGQQIHYHPGVSPDRLGKDPWVQQPDSHGWVGWDREHVSINGLCGTYLLTGSHLLCELVRSNVESWLLGATTQAGWSTTSRGAPRSVGRTLLAMAWCYQCTGDARIPQRMRERLSSSYGDMINTEAELVVLGVHGKDGRKLEGKHRFWMPWQEALGVVGLDAAWRTTQDVRFLDLAKRIARSLVRYGWWERGPGDWTVGDAIAVLEDGKPLPASAYRDASLVKDHSGTDFDLWSLPAVLLARSYFSQDGDAELVKRCDAILTHLRARRAERSGDAFDRFGEWGAAR